MRFLILAVALLAGCGDDPPSIRDLTYSPNAGIVGMQSTINGTVAYTDQDNDISQSQLELISPSDVKNTSSPVPIMNVGQGVVGTVNFTLMFTPDVPGNWHFNVWIIDLQGRPSNMLNGTLRVSNP
jgi:hypothetical protein